MSSSVFSVLNTGLEGVAIRVECQLSNSLPNIVIVGLANKSVDESKERLRSAFSASKVVLPKKRITLNLAPADLPKEGSAFDLAMAASIMIASLRVPPIKDLGQTIFIGELGLDGCTRAIRGVIGKINGAKKLGFTKYIIPDANIAQARLISGIEIVALSSVSDLYRYLAEPSSYPVIKGGAEVPATVSLGSFIDFSDVVGQDRAKRALEIAAAGYHNVLLNGPPGTGKSMLAKALPSILPPMSRSEMLEVTHIHSLSSKQPDDLQRQRPFRSPHHSASDIAIIGGGQNPRPGEISLAHRGVLFFDELPEFSRKCIESLRQPLEDKAISISRAKDTVSYPANFIFIATANPCPCGYYNSSKECSCSAQQILKYQKKLSGPILDRIDLHVTVDEIDHSDLLGNNLPAQATSSNDIQLRVMSAHQMQRQRATDRSLPQHRNSEWTNKTIKLHSGLSKSAETLLNNAASQLGLSARAYMKIIRVGRTIADLSGSIDLTEMHIAEAIQYRPAQLALNI